MKITSSSTSERPSWTAKQTVSIVVEVALFQLPLVHTFITFVVYIQYIIGFEIVAG